MIARISQTTKSAHTPRLFFSGVCALFVISAVFLIPKFAHAEYIESFVSDITVYKDSTFKVAEDITFVFTEDKHGIFRCIPTIHQDKASSLFKERYIDIEVKSVQMNKADVPYDTDKKDDELCIKIGDPITTVTGTHTYTIIYVVGGAISYTSSGESDLYYNVTGNEWDVEIKDVQVNVSSPDGVLMRERACYHGAIGKTDSCTVMREENGVVHFAQRLLDPHQGMTIAQALNRSKIPIDIRERFSPSVVLWGMVASVFIAGGLFIYRYKTKFKTGKTIIPQYEPYPGVKPMYAGLLFDGKLDPRDITAGIVYLAQQGFIRIKKIDRKVLFFFEVDDYQIEVAKTFDEMTLKETEGRFESHLLSILFTKSFKMDAKGNYYGSIGDSVSLSELKEDFSVRQSNAIKFLKLKKDMEKDLSKSGFFQDKFKSNTVPIIKLSLFFIVIYVLFYLLSITLYLLIAVVIVSLVILLFSTRRTKKGYEALDHLKGFKDFLSVTDKERFIFHNAPEKSPQQFMEYLPYAIAFGVEKQWAKTFEGITIPNPDWYDGGSVDTFNAVGLTQSLGGFATAFSASSGASASGGGGASGGGSGGGGGGSW